MLKKIDELKGTSAREIIAVSVGLALLGGALMAISLNVMLFIAYVGIMAVILLSG